MVWGAATDEIICDGPKLPPLPYRPTHTEGGRFHDIINNDREDDVFEDHVVEATEKCSSYSRDCSVKVGRKAEVA